MMFLFYCGRGFITPHLHQNFGYLLQSKKYRVDSLRTYPVAGMDGYAVDELTITKEAILGNRSFASVLENEVEKYIQDNTYIPLRLTQVRCPQLTLFQTTDDSGTLVIQYEGDSSRTNQNIQVEESAKPFHSVHESMSVEKLLAERSFPLRVSERSSSLRWAVDCGDKVAEWLSSRLGKKVRLVKAVKHPESLKHHFTWYTAPHAVFAKSMQQLAQDTGTGVDKLNLRPNIIFSGTENPYDEETWEKAAINGIIVLVEACVRCGYIGIERTTGELAQHIVVVQNIAKKHGMKFGIYLQPKDHGTMTLKVGDMIERATRS